MLVLQRAKAQLAAAIERAPVTTPAALSAVSDALHLLHVAEKRGTGFSRALAAVATALVELQSPRRVTT